MNPARRAKLKRLRERSEARDFAFDHKNISSKATASIGIYLQRIETGEANCASDRIRGEWVIKNSQKMELFNPKKDYDVVIFHIPCKAISQYGRIKILDICDKVWKSDIGKFTEYIEPIDAIIVPTEELKTELKEITNKQIYVINDGHDFSHYAGSFTNPHKEQAKEAVWFGYAENAKCLEPFINYIKSSGIKLKIISQHQNLPVLKHADIFVKWDIKTYLHEIAKADFAILPPNQNYKSNNKDITALLCGIPVAKTKEDISRFMNPGERKMELDAHMKDIAKYNVRECTSEYLKIIESIKKPDIIKAYSAICGGYNKPRQDITVFGNRDSDMFKLQVMNAKIYKILAHKYIDAPISIYLDGNIFLNAFPSKLASELLKDADIAVFKHPWRNCLYREHEHARKRVMPQFQSLMDQQVIRYQKEGMPEHFGLAECGMIIRRHNTATEEFNERWWAEICMYTNRDQMSFPYILWKMQDRIKINFISGNIRQHPSFTYVNHGK